MAVGVGGNNPDRLAGIGGCQRVCSRCGVGYIDPIAFCESLPLIEPGIGVDPVFVGYGRYACGQRAVLFRLAGDGGDALGQILCVGDGDADLFGDGTFGIAGAGRGGDGEKVNVVGVGVGLLFVVGRIVEREAHILVFVGDFGRKKRGIVAGDGHGGDRLPFVRVADLEGLGNVGDVLRVRYGG